MKRLFFTLLLFLYTAIMSGCHSLPSDSESVAAPSEMPTGILIEASAPSLSSASDAKIQSRAPEERTAEALSADNHLPLTEIVFPEIPTTWTVNCNKYISLRKVPYGKSIANIPKGKNVELLGWNDKYARVTYNGKEGYVLSNYILPEDERYFSECLDVVIPTTQYSYNQMVTDMVLLQEQYPDSTKISIIGSSEENRYIPALVIGNPTAEYQILLQGAIHGREHMTAWLLMAMAEYWLDQNISNYGDICYHIIPMSNPDGVTISQSQTLTDAQRQIYLQDRKRGNTKLGVSAYASLWKANGEGVDINRNFPSGWEPLTGHKFPSSERYKGTEPFSSAEAAALRDYTLSYPFDATISYHATGSIIYYDYGKKEPVNSQSKSLADAVNQVTGYTLADSTGIASGGYKDWVMNQLDIPSLTVEIGVSDAPLESREIYSIFVRNQCVLPAIARWLQK